IADERGRTTFGDLAAADREEFLQLRAHTRGASLPELGGLSLEDFRNSLRSSVLPRLGVMKVVTYPVGPLFDDAPVAFTPEAWAELLQEAAGGRAAADRLLEAAQLARAGIGYLAQEPSVFRKLTVEENIRAILETLPLDDATQAERLERLLDELAIRHLRRQKGFQLSGGERRRLEITRALVTEPKFMLLDEPFAGVDPIAVHDIQTIAAGLRHRGIGVLITDHNVEQTLDIVDRAY